MVKVRKEKLKPGEIVPLNFDYMFTEILNDSNNIEILENFISCYLDKPLKEIEGNLKIQSRQLKLESKQIAGKQVDLLLDLNGEKYNIELSNKRSKGVMDRNIVYASAIHARQLRYGLEDYSKIQKTIQINLNNYHCNEKQLIESYYLTNKHGNLLTEKLRIDIVDMEKAKKICYTNNERNNKLIRWCRVITSKTKKELNDNLGDDLMTKKAKDKLVGRVDQLSGDEEVIALYTKLTKEELERNTYLKEAREEGVEEGIEQGKIDSKLEIAKKLLKMGYSFNEIMNITDLSEKDIKSIK